MDFGVSNYVQLGHKTLHYRTWGRPESPALVVWHGVTGTSLDHVHLTNKLAGDYFVICPDALGCGFSDWPEQAQEASLGFHCDLVDQLFLQLGIKRCDWLGTSKGGALGICYAARGKHCTIEKLLLHDVGPDLNEKFRAAVARHIASPPRFKSMIEFELVLRKTLGRDGLTMSDGDWQILAQAWARRCDDGDISYHYSPTLAKQFTDHPEDFDLWADYRKINGQITIIKGEHSTVLDEAQVERMLSENTRAVMTTRRGGHISFLNSDEEIKIILSNLSET